MWHPLANLFLELRRLRSAFFVHAIRNEFGVKWTPSSMNTCNARYAVPWTGFHSNSGIPDLRNSPMNQLVSGRLPFEVLVYYYFFV